MKLNWKWILGITLLVAVITLPLIWQAFTPTTGSTMMRGYGYGMPMMNFGMMMSFGMWLMWLVPLGAFILIGFAFGWAAHQFTSKQN
jgi:hypothetical protein